MHPALRAAAGKTHAELLALEAGITERLDAGEAGDPEYWAAVLRRLTLHKAKARLRELHARLLERHLQRVVLAGDGVDVAEAMGWEAERQACQPPALACICLYMLASHMCTMHPTQPGVAQHVWAARVPCMTSQG